MCNRSKLHTFFNFEGHIYIWHHCDEIDPTWEIPEIPEITSGKWTYRGRTEHYVNAHIEEIPENGGDVAHLNIVHRSSILLGTNLNKISSDSGSVAGHYWKANWEQDPDHPHIGVLRLLHHMYCRNSEVEPILIETHTP